MRFYRSCIRPLFFLLKPEAAHGLVVGSLRLLRALPFGGAIASAMAGVKRGGGEGPELLGHRFRGYVGLAAGFDKQAHLGSWLAVLGFSFVEIGGVTLLPQPGNPRPRLFRLPADQGMVNRMGLNSDGMQAVRMRMDTDKPRKIPVGVNVGKLASTPNEMAGPEYAQVVKGLWEQADFFVVNVSCPNVQNLGCLQGAEGLRALLTDVLEVRRQMTPYKPILVKLGPDGSPEGVKETVATALELGVDGFVASNTTRSREGLHTSPEKLKEIGEGGLSGAPLHARALELVRTIRKATGPKVPIIGVGGISNGEQALAMLKAGASLIQVFTSWVYQGPRLLGRINRHLAKHRDEIPYW